jgi:hypothetical protein
MPGTLDKTILFFRMTHDPRFYDLSANDPFRMTSEIYRAHESDLDPRPLTLWITGSAFDVPSALHQGILELVDFETGIRVDIPTRDLPCTAEPPKYSQIEDSFLAIPPYDTSIPKRTRHVHRTFTLPPRQSPSAWPLREGRKYALRVTSSNLGVQWWNYTTQPNISLPSQPARLCCVGIAEAHFLVVPSLPHPPPLTITLSLSAGIFGHDNPLPISVRISTTNRGELPITVKNRFD